MAYTKGSTKTETVTGLTAGSAHTIQVQTVESWTNGTYGTFKSYSTAVSTEMPVDTTSSNNVHLYGSVNGKSKEIKTLYGSVNGKSKKIKKLYGSVGGKSVLIFESN